MFCNNNNDTGYSTDSYIYWGSSNGFSSTRRTDIPTEGAAGVAIAGGAVPSSCMAWGTVPPYPLSLAVLGTNYSSNYSMSSNITFSDNPGFMDTTGGIVFGYHNTSNYFLSMLSLQNEKLSLFKVNNSRVIRLGFLDYQVDGGIPYELGAQADGNRTLIYLNNTLVFNVTDPDMANGTCGLCSNYGEVRYRPHFSPFAASNLSLPYEQEQHVVASSPVLSWGFNDCEPADFQTYALFEVYDSRMMDVLCDRQLLTVSNSTTYGSSAFVARPLQDGKTYYWRIRQCDNHGLWGSWSDLASFRIDTPPSVPEQTSPVGDMILIKAKPVFTWNKSEDAETDGLTYLVQVDERGGDWSSPVMAANVTAVSVECSVPLEHLGKYMWRVRASDGYKTSNFSEAAYFEVRPNATVPGVPKLVQAVYSGTAVNVSWGPPDFDGDFPVEGYRIYRSIAQEPFGLISNTTMTSLTDIDLKTGSIVRYAISAFNFMGEGNRSISDSVPIGVRPGEPLNLSIEEKNMQLIIRWEPPRDTGGFPILNYSIHPNHTSEAIVLAAGDLSYEDTNLANGIRYSYTITATTLIGESVPAHISGIPHTLPGKVKNPSAAVDGRSATLRWDANIEDGGSAILFYTIYYKLTNGNFTKLGTTSNTTYRDGSIPVGTRIYRISSNTAYGEGSMSDEISAVILNIGPVAIMTVEPSSHEGNMSTVFTFKSSSYDPDGNYLLCQWDFGDGSNYTGNSTSRNYTKPGSYRVAARLIDSDGGTSEYNITINIAAEPVPLNVAPNIDQFLPASSNLTAKVGDLLRFDCIASDKDGDQLSYIWYYDNSKYSDQQNITIKMTSKGAHKMRLEVSDGSHQASKEWSIQVSEPAKKKASTPGATSAMAIMAFGLVLVLGIRRRVQ